MFIIKGVLGAGLRVNRTQDTSIKIRKTMSKAKKEVEAYGIEWRNVKPASPNDIASIEDKLKVTLPENLKELFKTCAGGYPSKNFYYIRDAKREASIGYILPVKEDKKISDVLTTYRNLHNIFDFPDDLIPFALDYGHANPLCLDIKTGEVIYWLTDVPSNQMVKVSKSLEVFLEGLSEDPF